MRWLSTGANGSWCLWYAREDEGKIRRLEMLRSDLELLLSVVGFSSVQVLVLDTDS